MLKLLRNPASTQTTCSSCPTPSRWRSEPLPPAVAIYIILRWRRIVRRRENMAQLGRAQVGRSPDSPHGPRMWVGVWVLATHVALAGEPPDALELLCGMQPALHETHFLPSSMSPCVIPGTTLVSLAPVRASLYQWVGGSCFLVLLDLSSCLCALCMDVYCVTASSLGTRSLVWGG